MAQSSAPCFGLSPTTYWSISGASPLLRFQPHPTYWSISGVSPLLRFEPHHLLEHEPTWLFMKIWDISNVKKCPFVLKMCIFLFLPPGPNWGLTTLPKNPSRPLDASGISSPEPLAWPCYFNHWSYYVTLEHITDFKNNMIFQCTLPNSHCLSNWFHTVHNP